MTTSKVFKKCAIALTVSTLLTAIPGIAQPASSLMADTPAKLQSQGGFETQFIIKYKENSEVTNFSNVDAHSLSIKKQVQNFVTNFTSKKSKIKARYIRAMALNNHHVMRADRKLSLSEAQEFMQEMVNSGNVEYIEIDQMLKPFSIPRAC